MGDAVWEVRRILEEHRQLNQRGWNFAKLSYQDPEVLNEARGLRSHFPLGVNKPYPDDEEAEAQPTGFIGTEEVS
jgi:hypothetical protein